MDGFLEATLPPLYAPWLREVTGGPIPRETVATCDHCVMLPPEGAAPDPAYFLPVTKCCAFRPTIPNYLAGRILADSDPQTSCGREALAELIARRVGVAPLGVLPGGTFHVLYSSTPEVFGRAPALRCPLLTDEATCGVWRHRPSVCATWHCKHVRGETGRRFWQLTDRLLRSVEADLALWCAAELNAGFSGLAGQAPDVDGRPDVSELGGPFDSDRYSELWGAWEGREQELYRASAKLVDPLEWKAILAICGPRARILARLVREAFVNLTSDAIPGRLRLGSIQLTGGADRGYSVLSYSSYDPLTVTEGLASILPFFDGRPTEEALAAIRAERKLAVDPRLLRRLVDFGILIAALPRRKDDAHGKPPLPGS